MWVGVEDYDSNDICPICHENYGTIQAIFKTPCNHLFHNNCLNDYCETYQGNVVCPVCRSDLNYSCTDVWAFKEQALMDSENRPLPFQENEHILNIYRNQNQISQQGGKKRIKTKRRKIKRGKTKRRKTRRTRGKK